MLRPLLLAASLWSPAASANEVVVDRVAALVNDEVIALSEVYDFGGDAIEQACGNFGGDECRLREERSSLEELIRRTLIRQELRDMADPARGFDVRVTPQDLDRAIESVVEQFGLPDREALRTEVEKQGVDWDSYLKYQVEDYVWNEKFIGYVLRSRVSVSDEELRDQYQRLLREIESPIIVTLSGFGYVLDPSAGAEGMAAIVTDVRAALQAVREGTRNWDEVISTYDTAGLSGLFATQTFRREDLQGALSDTAFSTELDQIADPVIANGVLYGIQVMKREEAPPDVPPFEEVKDRLEMRAFQSKIEQAADTWYLQATRRAALLTFLGDEAPKKAPAAEPTTAEGDDSTEP